MACINHNLTDEELHGIKDALQAIESKMYPDDPKYAIEGSRQLTIGVFRNLFTPDSVYRWIESKARELYSIPVEKGHGNTQ